MTIISMITLSALALILISHSAAARAVKQQQSQKSTVPVRIYDRR